jgi:phosphatidylinositol glycan class B
MVRLQQYFIIALIGCVGLPHLLLAQDNPCTITSEGAVTIEPVDYATVQSVCVRLGKKTTHQISPLIYGVALPEVNDVSYLNNQYFTVTRWGGNAVSLYNPAGYTNAGNDWYFENRSAPLAHHWIQAVQQKHSYAFFTMPALDYVAKDATSYSFSVSKYGSQQQTDSWKPDAGNGLNSAGQEIVNTLTDSLTAWNITKAKQWLQQLEPKPEFMAIDNELDIADSTHRDAHPEPMTYTELYQRFIDYAEVIKQVDPAIKVTGPVATGWWFYWNSAAGWDDKAAHNNEDFLPWFLQQVQHHDQQTKQRHLDYLDIHYYPAAAYNNNVDAATQALRLRSTRSLWDKSYTDESWIGTDQWATQVQPNRNAVQLIPRLRKLIKQYYPGTKLALTEWNWGAETDISSGLATADVLGIFGKQKLDLATYWTTPTLNSPAEAAFSLFRTKPQFGHKALKVSADKTDDLAIYAAKRKDNRTTIMIINKSPNSSYQIAFTNVKQKLTVQRYFSAATNGQVKTVNIETKNNLIVPPYAALFLISQ